jgi:carbon storage regulator
MLVLTRRVGEGIVITGDIQITVLAITGGRVRLGIAAPESIHVNRHEVHKRHAAFPAQPVWSEAAPAQGACTSRPGLTARSAAPGSADGRSGKWKASSVRRKR